MKADERDMLDGLADPPAKVPDRDPELVTSELADLWGMHPGTLTVWRSLGKGPKYNKRGGKVTYSLSDIAAYEQECKRDPKER